MASSPEITRWNAQWRSSPQYRQILGSVGVNPDQPVRLTDAQRQIVQREVERQMGVTFPGGIEIDPAGNMNENEGFGRQAKKWGPIVAAAAVTMFGIPGTPIGGLVGGGGAASGAGTVNAAGVYSTPAYANAMSPVAPGMAAGASSMAKGGFFPTLGKFMNSPLGAEVIGLGGDLVGGWLQTRAANRANDLQSQSNAEALAFLKEQDARDFAEYLKERDRDWRIGDEDRARRMRFEDERETRLAPYRSAGRGAIGSLASLLAVPEGGIRYPGPISPAARPRLADLVRA